MDRERERKILEKLDHDGYVKVSELSRSLGCTEVTLRRDLKHLDERGLLRRIHGGAVRIGSNFVRNNVKEALYRKLHEKIEIARTAYGCVQDGETIIIDDASTCMHMASAISAEPEKKVKVITNSILLAEKLLDHTHVELIMIGGEVACNLAATEGSTAYAQLGKLRADRAFIGVNGVDLTLGITLTGYPQQKIKQRMMEISERSYILADSSKFGKNYMSLLCPADAPEAIITDRKADPEMLAEARKKNIKVFTKSSETKQISERCSEQ